ncbi:MAG: NAD(P)H-hydrate dehydratase [Cyclobacteriaceae bacterium]|nr:NAD(P)H-hydrate dehydratase [Cyclobacteriaceae bacterium]
MLKILTSLQIKELDAQTILNEPVSSIDLMERACRAFTFWFTARFTTDKRVGIVCGTGNNGGDGLGIARQLHAEGYDVKVWIVRGSMPETEDFKTNLGRIRAKFPVFEIRSESDQNLFTDRAVLIDAVFGSGLSRAAEGIYEQVIGCINKTHAIKVAVDIPSGLMADQPSEGAIVKADFTVAFQLPKLSFLLPQSGGYVGKWQVFDIGLDQHYLTDAPSNYFLTEQSDIQKLLHTRSKFDHKGKFGHALLMSGSYGKMGAAVLSSRACLRAGVGLLTVHAPKCGYEILQTSVPEAMVSVDDHEHFLTSVPDLKNYSAIGIGPGIGQDKKTVTALAKILESLDKPVVLDADALNILGANRELIHLMSKGSVLTPHPKEFERLTSPWKTDFERLQKQSEFAAKTGTVVLVKGAYSAVASPDGKIFFNSTGNPGMATGGSGDVLTGIITGLLAQGYSGLDSAIIGCRVHGLAGDKAAARLGETGLIAPDIVDYLPEAFRI